MPAAVFASLTAVNGCFRQLVRLPEGLHAVSAILTTLLAALAHADQTYRCFSRICLSQIDSVFFNSLKFNAFRNS